MKYETVVFDLDGTLLDTLKDLAGSTNYALSVNGLPTRTLEEIRTFVGNGIANLISRAVPPGTASALETKCLADFRAHYFLNMTEETAPYPGVPELLRRLNSNGLHLAIVSNKFDRAVKDLTRTYFDGLIPVAIGESQGIAKKPAPDTVLKALEDLGVSQEGAVYVGDSEVDIQTAQNAGLPCLSVTWGFRDKGFLLEHGADHIVNDLEGLYQALCGQA